MRLTFRRDARLLAEMLVAELETAEAVVLTVPLYNFGVSQHFKTCVDLVMAGASVGSPLLKDKPTVLATGARRRLRPRHAARRVGPFPLRDLVADLRTESRHRGGRDRPANWAGRRWRSGPGPTTPPGIRGPCPSPRIDIRSGPLRPDRQAAHRERLSPEAHSTGNRSPWAVLGRWPVIWVYRAWVTGDAAS
ncbi:hypothetical protein [Streptomyces sp. SID339]|uniref:hypothetical protein n=1 Tax=unclassified Streptomyces TaxID=2593676 RepID=UPI0031BA78DB